MTMNCFQKCMRFTGCHIGATEACWRPLLKPPHALARQGGVFFTKTRRNLRFFESAASRDFNATALRVTGSMKRVMAGEKLMTNLGGSGRTDVIGSKIFGDKTHSHGD